MNTKFKSPQVIADLRKVDSNGDDHLLGSKVVGVHVIRHNGNGTAIAQIDVRDFSKGTNLMVEIELHELVGAISHATLNADQ